MKKRLLPSVCAVSVSVFICLIILSGLADYGITWDEPTYIQAGKKYVEWIIRPSFDTIDEYWVENHEHPPLTKVLGGLTNYIFNEKLNLFPSAISYRISIVLFVFFLNFCLFLFIYEIHGYKLALIVTLIFSFLPRVFFHSHIGALDYPVTAMWFLVIYTYWKGQKDQRWIMISSVTLGLALLTKLNAFFLYAPILLHWSLTHRKEISGIIFKGDKAGQIEYHKILLKLIPMIIVPPIIFLLFWPWLWKDTINRLMEYGFFHINHLRVPVYYLGNTYYKAPWEYPFLLTLITIPLFFLILFFIGIAKSDFRSHGKTKFIILFNTLFPLFIISISRTKYDGIRLFLPAFPFIAIISGFGLNYIFSFFKKRRFNKISILAYTLLFLLTIYFSIIKYHPYQSSYFNILVGGIDGAREIGFEPEYWGSSYKDVLPWLEDNQEKIYWIYMNSDPFYHYQMDGRLNPNIRFGGRDTSDYVILLSRFGMFNEDAWKYYNNREPVFSVRIFNTRLVSIYKLD